jgi:hypothetical protein
VKTFNVELKNGHIRQVQADDYLREGEQYSFYTEGGTVQFFVAEDVSGITEAIPPLFIPIRKKPRCLEG